MTSPSFDIIVCGSLHLDIMVMGAPLPRLDETAVGSAWAMKCGGKGGNQAVMSAKMGARTAMIGRVGKDDFGKRLLVNLDEASVDRSMVAIDQTAGSGMSVAILDKSGDYGAVIVSGANLAIEPAASQMTWDALGGAPVLVLQNEIPEEVNLSIAGAARASGSHIVLNAAPARSLSSEVLTLVDTLVVNRVEAEMMSGYPVFDVDSAMEALPQLGATARNVVITLGGAGLVIQARGASPQFIAPHKIEVVSTHGAGDCFIGALALRLSRGETLEQACLFANRMAAFFVGLPESDRIKPDLLNKA